tara:strand:+ start:697 stop:912 length:216 start_codon:yes stop_codon:yes gene_type:complete
MKTIVLYLVEANTVFTLDSELTFKYLYLKNEINNCFDLLESVIREIAEYKDYPINSWLMKDGTQIVGGHCK